jgi:hypothetical protein
VIADALGTIIPSVYENLESLAALADPPRKDRHDRLTQLANPFRTVMQPFSWKVQLIPFLVRPALRQRCPVTYAHMRLSGRFNYVGLLQYIGKKLTSLLALPPDNDDALYADTELEQAEDGGDPVTLGALFQRNWNRAVTVATSGVPTSEARAALQKTIFPENDEGVPQAGFRPNKLDAWPVLIVLESITSAHNEFIRIVQQYGKIRVDSVADADVNEDVVMSLTSFNERAVHSYRALLGIDGVPEFDEGSEQDFLKELAEWVYWLIILPAINCGAKASAASASESLVARFDNQFEKQNLDAVQRRALREHVRGTGKSPGLLLFLERIMLEVLSSISNPLLADKPQRETRILKFWNDKRQGVVLPLLEKAGETSFTEANNAAASSAFEIKHLSSVYRYLTAGGEDFASIPADSMPRNILVNFVEKLRVHETDIGQQASEDFPGRGALIAKIVADMKEEWIEPGNDKIKPIIAQWEARFIAPSRTLLSDDEKESLAQLKRNAKYETTLKCVFEQHQVLRKKLKGDVGVRLGALPDGDLIAFISKRENDFLRSGRTVLSGEERVALDDLKQRIAQIQGPTLKDLVEHFPKTWD